MLESRVLSPGIPNELTGGPASNNQSRVGKSNTNSRGPGTREVPESEVLGDDLELTLTVGQT